MEELGLPCRILRQAFEGLNQERPPITTDHVRRVIEEADENDGRTAIRWLGGRSIIVRYQAHEDEIVIRSVSATRRRLAP